jgi:hypothetical protein
LTRIADALSCNVTILIVLPSLCIGLADDALPQTSSCASLF